MKICEECGFDEELPRRLVFLCDNVASLAYYMANRCEICGHQSDGSTIEGD